jgi:hypothetical protein
VTSPTHRSEPHPAIWPDKPMPDAERRLLTTLSAGVWLIALAMNVSHVYDHLGQAGIRIDDTRRAVLCLAPDVLLLIGVWKLRYRARSTVAWAMVGTGLAWLSWSALSTAQASPSAWMLAIAPIAVAVLTTLALEFKHAAEPVGEVPALTVDAPTEPAPLLPPPPVAATDVAPATAPPAPRKTPKDPAKAKSCPTREQARAVLMAMPDFEAVSNAELARLHGGTDTFWRGRKVDLRAELAELTTEAGAL